jgi:hypothetical protein
MTALAQAAWMGDAGLRRGPEGQGLAPRRRVNLAERLAWNDVALVV